MDGTSHNQFRDGALLRPLDPDQASDAYWPIVQGMIFNEISLYRRSSADGIESYIAISKNSSNNIRHNVPRKDAKILMAVARKLRNLPAFPTFGDSDLQSLIRAEIKVSFT